MFTPSELNRIMAEYGVRKLLNIDANPKTVKGQKEGYMTAVLYLAPATLSGLNVCPMAELAGCIKACLNQSGRAAMSKGNARMIATDGREIPDNTIQRARINRTKFYFGNREAFMAQLVREIEAFLKRAKRANLIPCVRLNGTSDIQWERGHTAYRLDPGAAALKPSKAARAILTMRHASIFHAFREVQFYDYTKIAKRFERGNLPANYDLSLSFSAANKDYARACMRAHVEHGARLVVVARDAETIAQLRVQLGSLYVDGDEHDLRFRDPVRSVVVLKAKGPAKRDRSGFVVYRNTHVSASFHRAYTYKRG